MSAKMLRSLVDAIYVEKTPIFSKIRDVTGTMSLSLTYRLRGASYRICGAPYRPKSKRWKPHYLCMLSPPVIIKTVVRISRFGSVKSVLLLRWVTGARNVEYPQGDR